MGKVVLAVVLALALAGCATTQQTGSLCTVGPFRPDSGASERFTDDEIDQVIIWNESGEEICGWKP